MDVANEASSFIVASNLTDDWDASASEINFTGNLDDNLLNRNMDAISPNENTVLILDTLENSPSNKFYISELTSPKDTKNPGFLMQKMLDEFDKYSRHSTPSYTGEDPKFDFEPLSSTPRHEINTTYDKASPTVSRVATIRNFFESSSKCPGNMSTLSNIHDYGVAKKKEKVSTLNSRRSLVHTIMKSPIKSVQVIRKIFSPSPARKKSSVEEELKKASKSMKGQQNPRFGAPKAKVNKSKPVPKISISKCK